MMLITRKEELKKERELIREQAAKMIEDIKKDENLRIEKLELEEKELCFNECIEKMYSLKNKFSTEDLYALLSELTKLESLDNSIEIEDSWISEENNFVEEIETLEEVEVVLKDTTENASLNTDYSWS